MIIVPAGGQQVLFIEVPEDKQVKNRVHFDLVATDRTRDEEIDRVLALGATPFDDLRRPTARGVRARRSRGTRFCGLRSDVDAAQVSLEGMRRGWLSFGLPSRPSLD